jgi:periplasmic protein CpxP/Spy
MKNTRILIVAALLLTGLIVSASVEAQIGPRPGRGVQQGRMFDTLNLTDSQRKTIGELFAANRDTMRALQQRLREQHQLLTDASQKQPFDEAAVRLQAQEMAKLQSEIMVHRAALMNKVSTVLSADQRAKLQELRVQRKEQFKERFEQRRGRHSA